MCWNAETSFATYAFILVMAYLLMKRNNKGDKIIAVFLLCFGFMQFLEGFMWLGQKQPNEGEKCSKMTKIATYAASILLYLHPIFLCVGLFLDKTYGKVNKKIVKFLFMISIGYLVFGLYRMYKTREDHTYCSEPHEVNKHLVWDIPDTYTVAVILMLVIILTFKSKKLFLLFLLFFGTT